MKKLLYVIAAIVFFLLGLSFFVHNPQSVVLKYYLGFEREYPLTMVLLATFLGGVIVGYLVSIVSALKIRRRLSKANKVIRALEGGQG